MKKIILVSPSFSGFRTGEPIAYEMAERAYALNDNLVFKYPVQLAGNYGVVQGKRTSCRVYLNNDPEPYVFDVEVLR